MSESIQKASEARYVIVGPTGWIGSAALAWLSELIGPTWRERVRCFGSSSRTIAAPDGGDLFVDHLASLSASDVKNAVVLHLAYLTKDKVAGMSDACFIATNLEIDESVLSALRDGKPRGVFVASSGAARDVATGASRNIYGITKLLQEERFESYGRIGGCPVLTGRIYNIAGPHINKLESYAISSFILQGIRSGKIEINATQPIFRSFLHVEDLLKIAVMELLNGAPSLSPIDLCGPEVVEMEQIAKTVANVLGLSPSIVERGPVDYSSSSSYLGDPRSALMLANCYRVSLKNFPAQVEDTVTAVRRNLSSEVLKSTR